MRDGLGGKDLKKANECKRILLKKVKKKVKKSFYLSDVIVTRFLNRFDFTKILEANTPLKQDDPRLEKVAEQIANEILDKYNECKQTLLNDNRIREKLNKTLHIQEGYHGVVITWCLNLLDLSQNCEVDAPLKQDNPGLKKVAEGIMNHILCKLKEKKEHYIKLVADYERIVDYLDPEIPQEKKNENRNYFWKTYGEWAQVVYSAQSIYYGRDIESFEERRFTEIVEQYDIKAGSSLKSWINYQLVQGLGDAHRKDSKRKAINETEGGEMLQDALEIESKPTQHRAISYNLTPVRDCIDDLKKVNEEQWLSLVLKSKSSEFVNHQMLSEAIKAIEERKKIADLEDVFPKLKGFKKLCELVEKTDDKEAWEKAHLNFFSKERDLSQGEIAELIDSSQPNTYRRISAGYKFLTKCLKNKHVELEDILNR